MSFAMGLSCLRRLALVLTFPLLLSGQAADATAEAIEAVERAPVRIDGEMLFQVSGLSSYPASRRAQLIEDRILRLAKNSSYQPGSLRLIEDAGLTRIEAQGELLLAITAADARSEGAAQRLVAEYTALRIDNAIRSYRAARSSAALWQSTLRALLYTAIFLAAVFLFLWAYRRTVAAGERFCRERVERTNLHVVAGAEAERLWSTLHNTLRLLRTVVLLAGSFFFGNLVLSLFPWTRPFAADLFNLVLGPLRTIGLNLLRSLPDVAFLVVLFFVIRLVLRLIRLLFDAVERGTVEIGSFDPEWSTPTFRIVRALVIAFGLVVAYPYLPGSGSEAFKGVSLFIGVVFSLGSTGIISNLLAGYSLTYRRAFRVGDRVQIGDVMGDVELMRLQVTHLRSVKNEEIIIPNSVILNSSVINYSSLARKESLILHTTVGIGYETPWRQVEAMLLLAAERTPGLLRHPPPFVLQKLLGDFCVTYEINVHTDQPSRQAALYHELHRQILDVFNEYGVQIMTPAYEGDPPEPKVVRQQDWFASPALPPEPDKTS
jgi:small-conductance mechanosensitive channel